MSGNQFHKIIFRYFKRESDENEMRRLDDWLDESIDNQYLFQLYKTIWKRAEPPPLEDIPEFDDLWSSLYDRLTLQKEVGRGRFVLEKIGNLKRFHTKQNLRYAFWVVIATVAIFFGAYFGLNEESKMQVRESFDNLQIFKLPDDSQVVLAQGSALTYPKSFHIYNRVVFLSGRAFFKLAREERPFVVLTDSGRILANGSQFDVKATGAETSVTAVDGQVILQARKKDIWPEVIVRGGHAAASHGNKMLGKAKKVDLAKTLAWVTQKGVQNFEEVTLRKIVVILKRDHNLKIRIDSPELAPMKISGKLDSRNPQATLRDICVTYPINCSREEETFVLRLQRAGKL